MNHPTGRRKLRCHAPEQGRTANRFQSEPIESLRQCVLKIGEPIRTIVENPLAVVGVHDVSRGETAANSFRK